MGFSSAGLEAILRGSRTDEGGLWGVLDLEEAWNDRQEAEEGSFRKGKEAVVPNSHCGVRDRRTNNHSVVQVGRHGRDKVGAGRSRSTLPGHAGDHPMVDHHGRRADCYHSRTNRRLPSCLRRGGEEGCLLLEKLWTSCFLNEFALCCLKSDRDARNNQSINKNLLVKGMHRKETKLVD